MAYLVRFLIAGTACVALSAANGRATVRGFGANNEGFQTVELPWFNHVDEPQRSDLPYDPAFGNPAGSLRTPDVFGNSGVATPLSYNGNLTHAYGEAIEVDYYLRSSDGTEYPAFVINCTTDSLYATRSSPPVGAWGTNIIVLSESSWLLGSTDVAPTHAQFRELLTKVKGIYFLSDWHTGADDVNLDNIDLPFAAITGDTNFDNAVDFTDLLALAQNYGGPAGKRWDQGDFNGDGTVDFGDLLGLAQNYGRSSSVASTASSAADFDADWARAQSLVPEPAAGAITVGAIALLARRAPSRRGPTE